MADPFVVARPGASGYEPFIHQDAPVGEFRQFRKFVVVPADR